MTGNLMTGNWWSRLLLGGLLLLAPLSLVACAADGGSSPVGCSTAITPCLSGTATIALQTSKGEVQLQLDGAAAPLTAGNFVDLVKRGVYKRHRISSSCARAGAFCGAGRRPHQR